MMGVN